MATDNDIRVVKNLGSRVQLLEMRSWLYYGWGCVAWNNLLSLSEFSLFAFPVGITANTWLGVEHIERARSQKLYRIGLGTQPVVSSINSYVHATVELEIYISGSFPRGLNSL